MSTPDTKNDLDAKDDSLFWEQYVKEADLYDKELVKGLGSDLDTLLIFAGLFSAVNTAFIIESYQDLKPDPAESGGTNALLRTLIQATNNSTAMTPPSSEFAPAPHAIVVNALFFASLCCSLFAAFGAVLAKQWLNEYERTGDHRIPRARARQRHAKYLGMHKYHCEMVAQSLGTVLQVSLFLFFVALTNWLWGINHVIAAVVIVGFAITFSFYVTTTFISLYDAASPFSTRFSALLRNLRLLPGSNNTSPAAERRGILGMGWLVRVKETRMEGMMDGKCVAWVRDNATMFESVAGMARAAVHLPQTIRTDLELDHTHIGPVLLRSIISFNAIPLGLNNGTLFSTVNTLRDAMTSWKGVPESLACQVIVQLHQTLRLAVSKDPSLSESIALILDGFDLGVPSSLLRYPELQVLIELVQLPTLTVQGQRAAISILWKYHFRGSDWYAGTCSSADIKRLTLHSEGVLEDSWQWKVAAALAFGSAGDMTVEQRNFQALWMAAFGSTITQSRTFMFDVFSSFSPLWGGLFRPSQNTMHRYDRTHWSDIFDQPWFGVVAVDVIAWWVRENLSYNMPLQPDASISPDPPSMDVLEAAFKAPLSDFSPTSIAPLYAWFHCRSTYTGSSAAYITPAYLGNSICEFLRQQLDSEPWIPEDWVPFTVAAVEAYVEELRLDRTRRTHASRFDDEDPRQAFRELLLRVRNGSYRFQGPASIGQQLWDCYLLVVEILDSGAATWFSTVWEYDSETKVHTVRREFEVFKVLGSDGDSHPILGHSVRTFDSY